MHDATADILISIENRHVQNLLKGTKKVELRRRAVSVDEGSRVWIYSKIPTGQMTACGIVEQVYKGTPTEIWKAYGPVSGISKAEFDQYFDGRESGCAIVFQSVDELENQISLNAIREAIGKFQPPQFFKYLYADSPELELFNGCFA